MVSCTGVSVNVAVAEFWPAAIVSARSETSAKSAADAVPAETDTVTSVSEARTAPSRVPVTVIVVAPESSSTVPGDTVRTTPVDSLSSSDTVTATSSAVTEP